MSPTEAVNRASKPVVTLWETYGSAMAEIGRCVACLLQLPLHDHAMMSSRQTREGLSEAEQKLVARIIRAADRDHDLDTMEMSSAERLISNDLLAQNTRLVLRQAAEGGVILCRNSCHILREWPNVLHVMLDGPMPARLRNASERYRLSREEAAEAQLVDDRVRIQLSRMAYGYDPLDITNYDLVVNTARMSIEEAAQVIAHAAQTRTTAALKKGDGDCLG